MSQWLELRRTGGRATVVDTSLIGAVEGDLDIPEAGYPDDDDPPKTVTLLLRNGQIIDEIVGVSPVMLLAYLKVVAARDISVTWWPAFWDELHGVNDASPG